MAPPKGVRPTTERVREAVFSILWSMGVLEECRVIDLFAGSGAMGIEALSRGAVEATFVDIDAKVCDCVRSNLALLGLDSPGIRVVSADACMWEIAAGSPVDIIFCDPPYSFNAWGLLLRRLDSRLLVAESTGKVEPPANWDVVKIRDFGTSVVTVMSRRVPEST